MLGVTNQRSDDSGPPAPVAPPPKTLGRRYDVERSCIRCHERKVRCDKATPCTTCVRAKVQCRYLGPERTKRRSHKTTSAKVVPRLEVLERAAAINHPDSPVLTGQAVVDSQPTDLAPPSPTGPVAPSHDSPRAPPDSEHSEGFLLKEGSSTRYVNEFTFSRVLEKQGELQSAIDTPESNPSSDARLLAVGFEGLISPPHVSNDILSLLPSRWQATQLWQIYLNNIDGLVKILHIPTVQPGVFAAINNPSGTALDMDALLFSIYFAAVISLRSPDIQIILGQDRQSALNTYQRGLELSLHMGSFLDSPTIVSLQAMAIYLMCRRNRNSGRSGWILNGLLVRAAQAIGLHRDGEHFNLPPLECEIRRRLWWQILGSDGRAAEDHGLYAGPTGGYDGFSDTKLPTHVDDRDISPAMTTALASQPRWTETTHFLVATEMYQALQQINRLSGLSGDDKMTKLEQLLSTVKPRIETQYLQYCDANIPIQKCSLLLGRLLLGKSEVFIRQQYLRGLNAEESAARVTEDTLTLACNTIELGIEMKTDELLNNFQWLFSTFTEYHVLTYALWHLCVRPEALGADRAWAVVNAVFSLVETQGWPAPGSKWNVLRKLREKAAGIRLAFQAQASPANRAPAAELVAAPEQVPAAADLQQVSQGLLEAAGTAPVFDDGIVWDIDALCFPDWGGYSSGF